MSSWTMITRPTRATVEEFGKEAIEEDVLASLHESAAAQGEYLVNIASEWWEDGTMRTSARGIRNGPHRCPTCGVEYPHEADCIGWSTAHPRVTSVPIDD